jgi:uncharacterized protein YdeI (YjbR/CyaY-like superfamily)
MSAKPVFFKSSMDFRTWLAKNHAQAKEMWVGFYKSSSGKNGITYAEALDEALCYGWIDAVRKSIDGDRWTIRFTPRKPASIWSVINIGHVRRLTKSGRMKPSGLNAFVRRDKKKSRIYSYEAKNAPFDATHERRFKADKKAWRFFATQAPSYQKVARWWIAWAKQDETKLQRLNKLIEASRRKEKLDRYVSRKPKRT